MFIVIMELQYVSLPQRTIYIIVTTYLKRKKVRKR